MQAAGNRFVPWLYQQIEEDSIPGVIWVNRSQLVCQIPWQRGNRKSYSGGSLTELLQAWAQYSGRCQEPDLRTCMKEVNYALQNLKGVIRTVKVDEVEGYRLLQFDRTVLEKDARLDGTDQRHVGFDHQSGDRMCGKLKDNCNPVTSPERVPSEDIEEACKAETSRQSRGPPPLLNAPTRTADTEKNHRNHTLNSAENISTKGSPERSRSHSPDDPVSEGCDPDPEVQYPVGLQPAVASLQQAANSFTMEVIVFYFNREVARHCVENRSGCRLYYNSSLRPNCNVYGGPQVPISLPEPDIGFDTPSMKKLLHSMQLGLLIEMRNNDVYAKQLGLCSVFCNDTRYETTLEGRIRRFEGTKVYDYNRLFLSHFHNHCSGQGGCPSTELYFSFGQTWTCQRPAEENLLSVAVVHCLARSLVQEWSPHRPQNITDKSLELNIDPLSSEDEMAKQLFGAGFASR